MDSRTEAFAACPDTGCDWGSFYLGWKASREALVVEFPTKYVIDGVPVVTVAELKIRLDKAGIKWK